MTVWQMVAAHVGSVKKLPKMTALLFPTCLLLQSEQTGGTNIHCVSCECSTIKATLYTRTLKYEPAAVGHVGLALAVT